MKFIFLALLQGITEFLPVSSSGHLVFYKKAFGLNEPLLIFDIILHIATALSVIVFLRKDLKLIFLESFFAINRLCRGDKFSDVWEKQNNFRTAVLVLAAFVPTVLVGLLLNQFADKLFDSLKVISITFFITGLILFSTKILKPIQKNRVNILDAFLIGIVQAIAIIPGISRSGTTISCGIFRGIEKNISARFSFILAVPTVLAAGIYKLKDGFGQLNISTVTLLVSFAVAFLSGYVSLVILSKMIARAKFHYFAYYCWLMGAACIYLLSKTT